MALPQPRQQFDYLRGRDGPFGHTQVEVFVILRAVCTQDVQPFSAAAHTHQETLPSHQPATIGQFQAPDRVTGIQEVAPRGSARRRAVGLVPPDELLLLDALGLEQEAGRLVEAAPQTLEQALGATEGVGDPEGGLNPLPDLARRAEAAGLDLLLKLLRLGRGQRAGIASVVQGAEGV
jgi:hypothetical protein